LPFATEGSTPQRRRQGWNGRQAASGTRSPWRRERRDNL